MKSTKHHQSEKKQPKKQLKNSYTRFSGIAIQMFAIIGVGTYAGVKLDENYPNKHNLYTVGLSLTSVILAIIFVIKRILAASKDD